jgi:hypothetical protein
LNVQFLQREANSLREDAFRLSTRADVLVEQFQRVKASGDCEAAISIRQKLVDLRRRIRAVNARANEIQMLLEKTNRPPLALHVASVLLSPVFGFFGAILRR